MQNQFNMFLVPCRGRKDPHAGTVNDSYTIDDYTRMADLLARGMEAVGRLRWRSGGLLQLTTTQLFVHIMHFGLGRGDDTRGMRIHHIGKPRRCEVLSGVVDAYTLPITIFAGKTQSVSVHVMAMLV